MAVFGGPELKKWRKAQNVSAADLAERINCDPSTIFRYENETLFPSPEIMYQICDSLGDLSKWDDWMRTQHPSYARMHPELLKYGLEGTIMKLFTEVHELLDLQREVMADGSDGNIDCEELKRDLQKALDELIQAAQSAKATIRKGDR